MSSSSSESGSGRKEGKRSSGRRESGEKTVEYFHSILSKDTVLSLHEKYFLPGGSVVVPDDTHRANSPPEGYATVYEACLECGLRFPLPPAFVELLEFFQLPLGQVTPNSWRHLSAFAAELPWWEKDLSLRAILNFFQFKRKGSWFYLIPLQPFRAFCKTKWPKWQNRFFFYNRTAATALPWRGPKSVIPHPRVDPLDELEVELNKIPLVRKRYSESELVKGDLVFASSSSDEETEVNMLTKVGRKSSGSKEPEKQKTPSSASDAEKDPKRQKTSSSQDPESTSARKKGKSQRPPIVPERGIVQASHASGGAPATSEHVVEPFAWPTDFVERNSMLSKLVAGELSKASYDYGEMQRKLNAAGSRAEQAEAKYEKARAARITAQNEVQQAKNELAIEKERSRQREMAAVVAQGEVLRAFAEKLFLSNQFSAFIGDLLNLMTDNAGQGPEVVLPLYGREIAARLQSLPLLEELASSSALLSAEQVRSCRADCDENMEAIFASLGPVPPASIFKEAVEQEAEAGKEAEQQETQTGSGHTELVEQQIGEGGAELVELQLEEAGTEQEGGRTEAEAGTEADKEKEAETHREAGV